MLALSVFLLSVPPALAQHWDVEKVDSAGWGAAVDMRWHPDGRLFLCYSDTSGVIRLASKDSVWSYEDLPQWHSAWSGSQGFDIDRRGWIGVSYASTDYHRRYALKTDTGWVDIQTPFTEFVPRYPYLTTLDTAGAPIIAVQTGDSYVLACLRDTVWVTYILANGQSGWTNDFDCSAFGSTADGGFWGVFRYTCTYPGADAYFCSLNRFQVRDSDVSVVQIASAVGWIPAASGCVDDRDTVHSCYGNSWPGAGLYLDQIAIDTVSVGRTSVKFDSLDRPQIAYTRRDSGLMYRCCSPGLWHIFDLQTEGVTALSLIIGENSQPIIAYTTSEGVFLLRGVDVVGQSEEHREPTACGSRLKASVIRNVLLLSGAPNLKPQAAGWLLDAAGCRALDLRPGANDVSSLAPGVYFVREEPQASSRKPQAVQKVVITR